MPQVNQATMDLIKRFEGCELTSYQDAGGVWTIGYGHTGTVFGLTLGPHLTITQDQADALLGSDLQYFEQGVNTLVTHPFNPNQFGALVSFAYNLGLKALQQSTLMHYANKGMYTLAASQFGLWVYCDGEVLPGLVARRAAEKQLFLTPA